MYIRHRKSSTAKYLFRSMKVANFSGKGEEGNLLLFYIRCQLFYNEICASLITGNGGRAVRLIFAITPQHLIPFTAPPLSIDKLYIW